MIPKTPLVASAATILFGFGAAFAQSARHPIPVDVALVGDDGLTQKLAYELKQAIRKEPTLRLADSDGPDVVSVKSVSNVDWTTLAGRTAVIYRVSVSRGGKNTQPVNGACFENAITKCSKEIIRLVQIEAAN